jgi:hypothetical protein
MPLKSLTLNVSLYEISKVQKFKTLQSERKNVKLKKKITKN